MDSRDATYEWLRGVVSAIAPSTDSSSRDLVWATSERSLALARDSNGRVEVFIAGPALAAATKTVADVLHHQVWRTEGGGDLAATRVVLPAGDHFDQFAALLCVELIEHDLDVDAQSAFAAVEPLIVLALTREVVGDLVLMGLIGELALLEHLLATANAAYRPKILLSWAGSAPSARDFQLGSVGVEVKTTQGPSSVHEIEGVHQVELGHSNQGVAETALYLLSLGISWVPSEDAGRSLPEVVDSILTWLTDPEDRDEFLARVKQYGGDAAIGYDHDRDQAKSRYANRFYFRFERLYDMADERLQLLTSQHLARLTHIDPNSVSFRIVLPDKLRGELNPTTGWPALTGAVLASAGHSPT